MERRLLPLVFVFVVVTASVAQLGVVQQNAPGVRIRSRSVSDFLAAQRILLSNFCRLDYEGARLQAAGWNRFKPFTALKKNPEFERVVVVQRFDIDSPEQPTETVHVNYKAVGYYDFHEGYAAASASERVGFRVQEQNDTLLVTEIVPSSPHVSPRAALEWLNARLNDTNTSELERTYLKDAIQQVTKLVPPPHAVAQ